jgi:transposase
MRHRQNLVEPTATCINRMQKALTQMNLKLQHVLSDITGLAIVRDILAGVRDPHKLAAHRHGGCKASALEIVAALTGNYRAEHLFALRQNFEGFEFHLRQIADCDKPLRPNRPIWRKPASRPHKHCQPPNPGQAQQE